MTVVGTVAELWRYPVKSMGGEPLMSAYIGPLGLRGDRMLAFESAGAAVGKPLVTGAERTAMLRCSARLTREPKTVTDPATVEVTWPGGEHYRADNPAVIAALQAGQPDAKPMWLRQCERPAMDCRPVGLLSLGTLRQLSREYGTPVQADRFRANLLLDLLEPGGFGEDAFVGRTVQIGNHARLTVTERDPRCRVVTLDPETGERDPRFMTFLSREHDGKVGVYATVNTPGSVTIGDPVLLL